LEFHLWLPQFLRVRRISMITIKGVSFRYTKEQEAIRDINLEINAGECVLLC
jgi:ABC-type phosphate/phosphonate transport system ATPase subunit